MAPNATGRYRIVSRAFRPGFTVILHDGTFCLRPQTAQLWLNQAKVTATSDLIQLRQGDEIQIGRLMVRVHLNRGDIPHYDEKWPLPKPSLPIAICSRIPCYQRRVRHTIRE